MDLLPPELKNEARQQLKNVFDTFKRTVQLQVDTEGVTTIIDDADYSISDSQPRPSTQTVSIDARIWYLSKQQVFDSTIIGRETTKIEAEQNVNRIKIQVEAENEQYLKDSVRFRYRDAVYYLEDGWKPIGIFGSFDYIMGILRREQ